MSGSCKHAVVHSAKSYAFYTCLNTMTILVSDVDNTPIYKTSRIIYRCYHAISP